MRYFGNYDKAQMQPLSVPKYKSLVQTGTLWYSLGSEEGKRQHTCCNKIKVLVKFSVSFCHIVKCGSQSLGLAECLAHSHTPTHIQKERSLQPCQLMQQQQQQLSLAMPVWHTDTLWSPAHRLRASSSLSECLHPQFVCQPCPTSHRQANMPMKDLETLDTPSALFSHLDLSRCVNISKASQTAA